MIYSNKVLKNVALIKVIILVLAVNITFAQSKIQKLDKLLDTYLEYGKFNGTVLVADKDGVVYKKGFGMANMEWDIPNEPNTKHRLGSITKQFTSMLILQLVAEGKIDLDAPITTYLPDYPKESGNIITTHHLLTHTAGIPNYTSFPGFMRNETRDPYSPMEFIDKFALKDLEFKPGEKFNYSNSGYFLLGALIEKISGKTYEEMLQEKIFTPLNMNDSGFDHHDELIKNRATGYEKNGSSFVNSAYIDMSIPYAAGSLYSTVEDLYLWDRALYTDKLLPKKYMDLFFKPQIPAFGNKHYAYGWGVGKDEVGTSKDSIFIISHGGGINGFNTNIARSTDDKSFVVLLNNTARAPLDQMTSAIWGIMYDKSYDLPKQSVANSLLGVILVKGLDEGLIHYAEIKNSALYDLNENEINNIGYTLMGKDMFKEAAAVFKLNVEAFPTSFNTYDSYAEALVKVEDKEGAIANYRKSIELNPSNQNGIDMLKKLGEDVSDLMEEVVISKEILETYFGKYELSPGFVLTIFLEGDQMKAQATGQPAIDIFPKSENNFYAKVINGQIIFNKNEKGNIGSLTLFQNGQEMQAPRLVD